MVDSVLRIVAIINSNLNRKWCKRKPFSSVKNNVEFLSKTQLSWNKKLLLDKWVTNRKKNKEKKCVEAGVDENNVGKVKEKKKNKTNRANIEVAIFYLLSRFILCQERRPECHNSFQSNLYFEKKKCPV